VIAKGAHSPFAALRVAAKDKIKLEKQTKSRIIIKNKQKNE